MSLPVERIVFDPPPDADLDLSAWPFALPVVEWLKDNEMTLGPLTVIVGENGTGKSTVAEAVAMAFGMSPEGGSTGARHRTRRSESELFRALRLVRGRRAARWGFFLRAETMHGLYTYLEETAEYSNTRDPRFHEMSHGESFVEVLTSRFQDSGLYVLDEPESALSFTNCLGLVGLLHRITANPSTQVVVATHSPIIAAIPGAEILEAGEWGLRQVSWDDLDLDGTGRPFSSDLRSSCAICWLDKLDAGSDASTVKVVKEDVMTASRQAVLDAVRKRLDEEPERVLTALRVIADPDALVDEDDDATVSLARTVNAHRVVASLREIRAGSFSTEQVRELLGGISRQAVSQRVKNRRLMAIEISGRSWFPDWQFVDGGLAPGLPEVVAALAETGHETFSADAVMRTALPEEGGRSPGDLLQTGDTERAIHYVRAVGGGF